MKTSLFQFLPLLSVYLLISAFPMTSVHGNELESLKKELQELDLQEKEIKQRKEEISKRIDALNPKLKSKPAGNIGKKSPLKKTSASMSYYWDNRDFTTLNLLTSTTGLPYDFSIWGFIDLHGAHESSSTDLSRYFIEYRLNR